MGDAGVTVGIGGGAAVDTFGTLGASVEPLAVIAAAALAVLEATAAWPVIADARFRTVDSIEAITASAPTTKSATAVSSTFNGDAVGASTGAVMATAGSAMAKQKITRVKQKTARFI
jgi:hypothetical protein